MTGSVLPDPYLFSTLPSCLRLDAEKGLPPGMLAALRPVAAVSSQELPCLPKNPSWITGVT